MGQQRFGPARSVRLEKPDDKYLSGLVKKFKTPRGWYLRAAWEEYAKRRQERERRNERSQRS